MHLQRLVITVIFEASNVSSYQVLIDILLNKMDGKMNNLISVVVTCYNHEKYIEQCLRSIFNQTYRNIELIVLDDGSTDSSTKIIQEVLKDSPFETRFETHENLGVVKNRNMGLGLIKGGYLLFVDSDNYLDMDYIEQLYSKLIDTNADIAYCDLFNPEKEEYYLKSREFALADFLNASFIDNCSLIRRNSIGNARYDENLNRKKLEDYDFLLNLIINNGAEAVYQPNTKLNYRVFETGSISGRDSVRYHYEVYLEILEKYLDKLPHEIYSAVCGNLMVLEERLDKLLKHHEKVTDYVHQLKKERDQLERRKYTQSKQLKDAHDDGAYPDFTIVSSGKCTYHSYQDSWSSC